MKAFTCRRRAGGWTRSTIGVPITDQMPAPTWNGAPSAPPPPRRFDRSATHCGRSRPGGVLSNEGAAGFTAAVVSRLKAEHDTSIPLKSAGCSRTCTFCMSGPAPRCRDGLRDPDDGDDAVRDRLRPDSLAAILNVMATPLDATPAPPNSGRDGVPCPMGGAFSARTNGRAGHGVHARRGGDPAGTAGELCGDARQPARDRLRPGRGDRRTARHGLPRRSNTEPTELSGNWCESSRRNGAGDQAPDRSAAAAGKARASRAHARARHRDKKLRRVTE
jgi:hypothetical protein